MTSLIFHTVLLFVSLRKPDDTQRNEIESFLEIQKEIHLFLDEFADFGDIWRALDWRHGKLWDDVEKSKIPTEKSFFGGSKSLGKEERRGAKFQVNREKKEENRLPVPLAS